MPERDQLFLSYSARADPAVIGELKRVLGSDKYAERIKVDDWETAARPGPITPQIVDSVRASRFGICYLSELDQDARCDGRRFKDNPNVLFEAGMFHVLRHNRGDSLHG